MVDEESVTVQGYWRLGVRLAFATWWRDFLTSMDGVGQFGGAVEAQQHTLSGPTLYIS
jgi:hypothetical protein